ncbi:M23 family metallopeptidase [Pseudoclavibacter endophyticus]|uniref:M23 family metallopeptidase n=1 Tax=Pseudoclavibacter endophyticus TaxID=1778590 RepID=A0A6H9WPX4_9MICO|nr:M23 family metallopeptidase [Pseudoclavibacter endophyticus]KAB1648045.1 M23 family metallopeptidase [Pseudoclavibacter endophyticus]
MTRREIREAERRAALAAESAARTAASPPAARSEPHARTDADAAAAPLAYASRRARRAAERGPAAPEATPVTPTPAASPAASPSTVTSPSTAVSPSSDGRGDASEVAPLTRRAARRAAASAITAAPATATATAAAASAPSAPAKVGDARTLPAVVVPAAVAVTPAITPVAALEADAEAGDGVVQADVELPLSFRRNQAALTHIAPVRTGSKRALVRVKRDRGGNTRRGAALRGTAGLTALGFAATVAVATTLPAVANNSDQQSQQAADAAIGAAGGAQSLSVGSAAADVETASADSGREPGYAVATMGSATAYNTMFGIQRPDPSTYWNDPMAAVQWPFPEGVVISDYFGSRNAPCSGCSSDHKGIDMTPGEGTPIGSIADGTVVTVHETDNGGLGVYVEVEHIINGERITSLYGHLLTGSIPVKVGDTVKVGDEVGKVGNTGSSTGAHLHLEIHVEGVQVDPYAYLQEHNSPETVVVRADSSVSA